jgi:AsmA protein
LFEPGALFKRSPNDDPALFVSGNPMAKTPSSSSSAPKKGGLKTWLIRGVVVLAVLGVVAVVAPFFIPWNKLKDQATAFASEKLGRKLSIEKVEVSIFTGVKLVNVELANGRGFSKKEPLFKNASAKLDLSLLSLLTGKVVINAIEFKAPNILIEKSEDGHFNFSDLGGKAAPSEEEPAKEAASAPKELPIVLASFVINDGTIVYRDHAKRTETSIHGLDVKLLGFSLKSGGDQRLELKLTAELEGKKIPISAVSDFKLDLAGESLAIKSFDLTVPSIKMSASGAVKGFKTPDLDLKAELSIALASVAKDLLPPSMLKSVPGGLALDGGIKLNLSAKGAVASLDQMALDGALSFDKVGAKYGDYPALKGMAGTLKFDKAGADLPSLAMDLGGSPVSFAFNAKWGDLESAKKLKAVVTYKLTSPKLILDPIMPILLADDTKEETEQKAAVAAKTGGIQDLSAALPAGLSINGSIAVDAMVYKKISTGKLTQQLVLARQKLKSATNLDLYGGTFWERSTADLTKNGPPFSLQSGLSGVKFEGLIDDAAASFPDAKVIQGFKGKVFGLAGYKVDASGKGFKQPARFKNLKADGSFFMKDGKILKTEWQDKLAAAIPHPQTQEAIRKDLVFQNLRGEFSYSAEKATLKSFALGSGEDWRAGEIFLQATGTLVPKGAIDLKVVPHFSPQSVKLEGDLGQAFSDSKGWATYDYIAYYGPTIKEAKADFGAGIKNAAKNALNKKMDEAKQKAGDEVKKQAQEKAGDLLKKLPGLFGK